MKNTDLRTEFTAETQKRFNVEWIAYNDYAEWLEQKLVKLLTITPVIKSVCPKCGSDRWIKEGDYCECTECMTLFKQTVL